jgi:hypothetical protein
MVNTNSKFGPSRTGTLRNSKLIAGAAIMLALWALFMLSALVISWALDIQTRLAISGEGTRLLKAEAAACSGAEVAMHPQVKPGSPNLTGQLDKDASYEVHLTGEGGRLDINWLTQDETQHPEQLEVLRRYLENKGIDLNEREAMVDALLDWVEPNTGLHHLNAPPESEDYHPAHERLTRIDELKKVAGWADFTSQPGWDDDFTVSSYGPVDLQWASRDVLLALPGFTPEMVDRFLQLRRGPDGVDGTADDMQFGSPTDVVPVLGLRPEQLKALQGLIRVNFPIFRVVSVGSAGDATRTVQMVVDKGASNGFGQPSVRTWKEY